MNNVQLNIFTLDLNPFIIVKKHMLLIEIRFFFTKMFLNTIKMALQGYLTTVNFLIFNPEILQNGAIT